MTIRDINPAQLSETLNSGRDYAGIFSYQGTPKRLFDIAFALLLLPFLIPVIGVLWATVRRDGGPGFFGHKRVGRDGRMFHCWKLRTMVVDAEIRLREHLASDPEAAQEWKASHKLKDDPRVTRWGAFLRKTSLDELPQIFNVIKGEMSFVGPRPIVMDELEKYGAHRDSYLMMRPGITGLWQVNGRNDTSYEHRVRLDHRYSEDCSFVGDLGIIVKTGTAVLGATGY